MDEDNYLCLIETEIQPKMDAVQLVLNLSWSERLVVAMVLQILAVDMMNASQLCQIGIKSVFG